MIDKDLMAASSRPLVLSILAQGESYGYALIQRVRELSEGEVQWADGMLYPVLHRLEKEGLVESSWRASETGRRRKYYWICKTGQMELARQRKQWLAIHTTLKTLWEMEPCPT
jgi:PadR family transcriptional regulator, regulatory protein PadR